LTHKPNFPPRLRSALTQHINVLHNVLPSRTASSLARRCGRPWRAPTTWPGTPWSWSPRTRGFILFQFDEDAHLSEISINGADQYQNEETRGEVRTEVIEADCAGLIKALSLGVQSRAQGAGVIFEI
jgi:hypothetical protein